MFKTTLAFLTLLPSIAIAQPGIRVLKIAIDQPVYTNQSLWIRAQATPSDNIRYPFHAAMEDIGCNRLEVKRDGVLLKPHPLSGTTSLDGILCGSAAPSGSPEDRLPIHVLYPLDKPGTYSIRWTVMMPNFNGHPDVLEPQAQSEWLTFEAKQSTPEQQEVWIQTMLANPPTDRGQLAGDYLPSILAAAPDPRVFQVFLKYLHSQDSMVAGMAASGIERFPLSEVLPAVTDSIEHGDPSDELAYFGSYHKGWTQEQQSRIVQAMIPFLQPSTALQSNQPPPYAPTPVSAAIKMLHFIFYIPNHAWPENPNLATYADSQVLLAAPNIMARANENAVQELAIYLGSMQSSAHAHDLLLEIAKRTDTAGKQAQICLNWHHQ